MLKKTLVLSFVLVAFVNCSKDNDHKPLQSIPSDTPTEFINDKGEVVDTQDPTKDEQEQAPLASLDENVKQAWNSLNFGEEFLMSELIGSDICSISEKQFVGCFFAAHELTEYAYGPGHVLVISGQQNKEFVGELVYIDGYLSVHKIPAATLDTEDPKEVSAYAKRENDFFKETVKAAKLAYASKFATNPGVQSASNAYKKAFPKAKKALDAALRTKDKSKVGVAGQNLKDIVSGINSNREFLNTSVFAPYANLVKKAFAAIPELDRGVVAMRAFNTYLRNSADGHARIDLHDRLKAELIGISAEPEVQYGIGTSVTANKNGVYLAPLPGSAAEAAGVQQNDRVVKVNGADVTGIDDAVRLIKGERGTEVVLVVERWADKSQHLISMKRGPIVTRSHTLYTKVVNGKTYGMIVIATFMDNEMAQQVREFVTQNDNAVEGYILDLRNNPGGLLNQAVDLCGVFLPANSAVVAASSETDIDVMDPNTMDYTTQSEATKKSLVILINGRSASASEVVSGVLQEYKRGLVVGTQSFGKGTMQRSNNLSHPDVPEYEIWSLFAAEEMTITGPMRFSLVNFWKTTGRYFYPSGRTPEWVGVTPDVVVTSDPFSAEMFSPREQDQYPFSFGDLGASWVQTRPELVTQVNDCVNSQGASVKTWNANEGKKPFVTNYQELFAYDALKCI